MIEPLDEQIVKKIWEERDRMAATPNLRLINFGSHNHGWGSHDFHCDVWAVRMLLEGQLKRKKVTDGMIARWMATNGLSHGYSANSLRTMVWRARAATAILKRTPVSGTFDRLFYDANLLHSDELIPK